MLYCAVKYTVSGPAGRLQHSSVGAVQHWLPWAAPTQGAVPSLPTHLGEDHVFIGSTGPGRAGGTVILGGSPETCPKYTNLYILERETLSCQRDTKDMEKINFLPTVLCSLMLICPSSGSLVGRCPPHPFSLTCIFPRTFSLPCLPIGPISCSAPPPFTLLDVTLGPAFAPPLSPQPIGPDALLHPTVPIFKPGSSTLLSVPGPFTCAWDDSALWHPTQRPFSPLLCSLSGVCVFLFPISEPVPPEQFSSFTGGAYGTSLPPHTTAIFGSPMLV